MNIVILKGRLTKDPDFRQTQNGVPVCRITIAVDGFKDKDGNKQTDFIDCTAWRKTAEFLSRYFTKGQEICVEGNLKQNNYTDNNGTKHYSYAVQVNQVHFCGSKNDSAQSSTSQAGQAQTGQNNDSLSIGELGEFEQVLGNGEVPF